MDAYAHCADLVRDADKDRVTIRCGSWALRRAWLLLPVHQRDRASARRVPLDRIEWVIEQYRTRYFDFTIKHFHIESKGLFGSPYTDRGSHYFVTPKAGAAVNTAQLTQVGRALKQLGIVHIPSCSP